MSFLVLLMFLPFVCGEKIIVTYNGPLQGISVADGKVDAFLGVPYAEPPIGRLRFAKPVPKSSWTDIYAANKLPKACVQADVPDIDFLETMSQMSEDCLYLNLWVPKTTNVPKPIMLFIHGGGYMFGTSSMKVYDGAKLSERGDVIVVTINYRIGSLGFFTGFVDEAPGNMAMYDQVMAIQWIKDNAKHFGGDPGNIVLFGESAGSFSVSLHLLSPLSRNLFSRAILESGSVVHPWYSDNNKVLSKGCGYIAEQLGCADDDDDLKRDPLKVIECMKNLPQEKFAEVDRAYFNKYGFIIPRVGDEFLPEDPTTLFRDGKNKNTEVIIGVNRDEGPTLLFFMNQDYFGLFGQKVDPTTFDEISAKKMFKSLMKVDESVFQAYLDRVKDDSKYTYLKALCDAFGDFIITCGSVFQAEYQSVNKNPVYFYLFDHKSSRFMPAPEWIGVPHFEELPFVFGNLMEGNFTDFEKELSNGMMDMWAAFAKTGYHLAFEQKGRWLERPEKHRRCLLQELIGQLWNRDKDEREVLSSSFSTVDKVFLSVTDDNSFYVSMCRIVSAPFRNPTISGEIKWPQYTHDDPKYLIIGREKSVGVGPFRNRCEAWRKVFQAVVHDEL